MERLFPRHSFLRSNCVLHVLYSKQDMDIRIVLFTLVILLGLLFSMGKDDGRRMQKWYVILMIMFLILESSLRSVWVGPDTYTYYTNFESIKSLSWSEVWSSFYSTYQQGEGKDPGFTLFVKIVQFFSGDFNFFLFIAALIFFAPLGLILYKYSSHVVQLIFAFTLYVALFHIVALSGIRQQIATGFTFFALYEIGRGRWLRSLLLIGLASFIHISALIFLLVPAMSFIHWKRLKPIHLATFFAIPIVALYAGAILRFTASFMANQYYSAYGAGESTGEAFVYIIMMELLSLFCYIEIKKDMLKNNSRIRLLYLMLPLLTITVPLISLNGTMIRIGQYFTLYMMLLAPISIDVFTQKSMRVPVYIIMIVALLFLSLKSSTFNYTFFWQYSY